MQHPATYLPLVLTVTTIALVVWNGRRPLVSPLLTIAWTIHLALWCLLPFLIQPFLTEGLETSIGPLSRQQLATLHAATMLVLAVAFIGLRYPFVQPVTRFFDQHAPDNQRLFWPALVALMALVAVELRLSQVDGGTFAEAVAVAVTADAGQLAESGLLSSILVLLVGFSFAILSMGTRENVSRSALGLAWASLLLFSAFSIARGSRAAVLVPAAAGFIAISTLRGRARKRAVFGVLVVGVLTVFVGAPVAAVMGVVRSFESVDLVVLEDAYTLLLGGTSVARQTELIATEVNRKFDAVGPGVELLAMEPPGSAGLTPILSATVSPIPRILFPSKPVPTSRDGTSLGIPYRIAAKAYGDPELGQVMPVAPTAIALWEFGWLGPLALVLANLLSFLLLNSIFISKNVYLRAIGLSVLGLPTCEFFVGHPSALVQNSLRLCLYLVLLSVSCLAFAQLKHASRRPRALTPSATGNL